MNRSFVFLLLFFLLLVACSSQTDVPFQPDHPLDPLPDTSSPSKNPPIESSSSSESSLDSSSDDSSVESTSEATAYTGDLLLIDTHAHILPDREENDQFLASLTTAAQKVGVSKIAMGIHARHMPDRPPIYSKEDNTLVLEVYETYPDMIIPLLGGFDPADPNAVSYVEEQLKTGQWKGLAELDLRNSVKKTTTAMNDPTMMEIYALAAKYDVPVMTHYDFCYETDCASGKAEYEDAIQQNPDTIFITGHVCQEELMKKYDNLYCEYEISTAELPDATLLDRVMIGTDVQHANLDAVGTSIQEPIHYEEAIAILRERLEALDDETAERVAHGTAEEVFHLS